MSQVRKLQTGGTAPKANKQLYTVKVNGNNFDMEHEELQSWFNDYMKAGGGKTKNRDEWNQDFNSLLGTIKQSNSQGQAFDFDLQGDTVGDVTAPQGLSNEQQGLNDKGKAAKAGIGASITGVKNKAAMRGSLLSGLADYTGRAYTNTMAIKDKEAKDLEAKAKVDADKLKADNIKNYSNKLDSFNKDLDPGSNWRSIDGKNANMDFALKNYHGKLDENGRKNLLNTWGNKVGGTFNELYNESQTDPELAKLFESKFGKDASSRLQGYGTSQFKGADFIRKANPETLAMFTDPETYKKMTLASTPAPVYTQNPDGTFGNGDGKAYIDDKGTLANGADQSGRKWINGSLAEGTLDNILYRKGSAFSGIENNLRYQDGALYSGAEVSSEDVTGDNARFDRTNYKSIPLRLEGKSISFDEFVNKTASDPKYKGLAQQTRQILDLGKFKDGELEGWTTVNSELDRNAYDPYEGIEASLPSNYKNLSGSFSNFDPEKQGAIIEEFSGKYDAYGNPITNLYLRRSATGRIKANIERDNVGRYVLKTLNGEKIYLGDHLGNKGTKDLSNTRYSFSRGPKGKGLKIVTEKPKNNVAKPISLFNDGGKLDKLKKLQYGGIVNSSPTKEKYREVGSDIFNDDYTMTTADKFQLGALVADIGALGLTMAPGVGNVAAAGVGVVGTLANLGANISKDGADLGDAGEAVVGLGLDALTLLPGLGTGAKSAKVLRALKGSSKAIGLALAGAGAYQAQDSFRKILSGQSTIDDWRHLATGLTGALSGKRMAFDGALATTKGAVSKSIKDASGNTFKLTPQVATAIEEAKSQKDKVGLAKNYIASQLNKGMGPNIKPDAIQLDKSLSLNGWKLPISKEKVSLSSFSEDRTLKPLGSGFFADRAIKRTAMGNPGMAGADEVLGQMKGLGTTPWGRKFAWSPFTKRGVIAEEVNAPIVRGNSTNPTEDVVIPKSSVENSQTTSQFKNTESQDIPNAPNTAVTEAADSKGLNLDEARRRSNKLMNIYIPKANKSAARANKIAANSEDTKAFSISSTPTSNDKTINYLDVVKPKKQEEIKDILETSTVSKAKKRATDRKDSRADRISAGNKPKSQPVTADKEVKDIRRSIGLATDRQHEIDINTIFSPKKGTVQEALSKRILKNKKLTAVLESAIQQGKTSIKLKKGGILKAVDGRKLPNYVTPEWIKNFGKRAATPLLDAGNFAPDYGKMYTTGMGDVLGIPKVPQIPTLKDVALPTNTLSKGATPIEQVSKPSLISSFLKGIDRNTVSEFGRALYNRNLSKNVDTRVEVPMLSNVTEVSTPVKGDLLLNNAYNSSANRVMSDVGRARTSDSGIELAGRLSGYRQAEDLRMQGAGANAEAIARSSATNIASQQQYAGMRNQVANQNASTLANKTQAERQLQNQKMLAMGKSIDNFWASQNQKDYMNSQYNKAYDSEIAGMKVNSMFSKDMANATVDANTADENYQRAIATGDVTQINAAKDALLKATEKGNKINSNVNYLRLQLGKNPKWAGLDGFDINGNPFEVNNAVTSTLPAFRRGRMFASGGKLTAEDKVAIATQKETNKNFKETAKEYNKWLTLKMKEDNKSLSISSKSIGDLIKRALNPL